MRLSILAILMFTGLAAGSLLCLDCRKPRAAARSGSIFEIEPPPPEAQALRDRLQIKCLLARRVIAERIPLLEAAELFREANGEDGMRVIVTGVPGRSVREKLCRHVISYVNAAEMEMETEGRTLADPRMSDVFRQELELRMAAGEFPPEPQFE